MTSIGWVAVGLDVQAVEVDSSLQHPAESFNAVTAVSFGLTPGVMTKGCSVLAQIVHVLTICSSGVLAELSVQKSSSSSHPAPFRIAVEQCAPRQSAHTAPPDVPLKPTIW